MARSSHHAGFPFSAYSFEVLGSDGKEVPISLESGGPSRCTSRMQIPGIRVDTGGTTQSALHTREFAASKAWFQNHRWFRCHWVPIR